MTVLFYQRLLASREEKKQGASSPTLPGRRWAPSAVSSVPAREEVGGSETCVIKRRHPGGGGRRRLNHDPWPREEVEREGLSDLPFQGGGSRSDS